MVKGKRQFISGVLVGAFLFGGSAVFAAPIKQTIDVIYNNIKIKVDGNFVNLVDSEGNQVKPFIYNGTTYLPVGAISQAFGKPVSWDSSTSTVVIGKDSNGVDLTSLDYARTDNVKFLNINSWVIVKPDTLPFSGDGYTLKNPFKIAGKEYSTGIAFNMAGNGEAAKITYNTNSMYERLTGAFGTDDMEKNAANKHNVLIVYGDGKEIYKSPKMEPGDTPIQFDISLKNVNQIEFYFDTTHGSYPVLVNPKLY